MTENPTLLCVVAAALVRPDGKVLLAQRPAGKNHGGLWEFPGGKVDPGETLESALVRELAEELAIVVSPENLAPATFAADGRTAIFLFACRTWEGEARCVEAQALEWHAPAAVKRLPMPPLDYPLARRLGELLCREAI